MIRKPRPIEFMLRGYELSDTLRILDNWDALSEEEKRALGFTEAEVSDQESSRIVSNSILNPSLNPPVCADCAITSR
jgi:hypothetical protein